MIQSYEDLVLAIDQYNKHAQVDVEYKLSQCEDEDNDTAEMTIYSTNNLYGVSGIYLIRLVEMLETNQAPVFWFEPILNLDDGRIGLRLLILLPKPHRILTNKDVHVESGDKI